MCIIVLVIMGLVCRCCCHTPSLSCHSPCRSITIDAHIPPYEQMLISVGVILLCCRVIPPALCPVIVLLVLVLAVSSPPCPVVIDRLHL